MDKSKEYRLDAAAAVKLAESAESPRDKAFLLKLAQGWLDLAHQKEEGRTPFRKPPARLPRRH